ncbi:peptide chain release factor-like protein [Parvicella tangerina]|uniref:Prokaryotic-type class I peptide chain release factors domain-containing protein n=1 Tax=Parvicella tangerina TaxID=2829795 RepID=A0A916N9C7_9FLAO|nr:peptide chain release factor-like protein [Parvicella tangerina]CAG5076878.1 hypothetical protein CRYO30217_00230 [Parvicella tangerina]
MTDERFNSVLHEVIFSTARSGGPGGQHVNKTETKVILKWNFEGTELFNEEEKELMQKNLSTQLDTNGQLSLSSTLTRSQLSNKEDVIRKFRDLLEKALIKPKKRKETKVPKSVIAKRKKDKKVQSERKSTRKKIDPRNLMIALLVALSINAFGQELQAPRLYSEVIWAAKIDSLRKAVGEHKTFIPEYELASLVALMHYPELKDTKIEFKTKSLSSTMAARPKGLNVFRRKGKRLYVVIINNTEDVKVPVDSVSFNAKVGVIGHELAHILDYESKCSLRVMGNGIGYSSKKFRARFERATDQRTIDHGLGWQCYDWSHYVYHYKHTPKEYLEYKKKTYMSYEEIQEQLNN